MLKKILFFLLYVSSISVSFSQTGAVNLERPVNSHLSNEKNPSFSGNGVYLIFETDYGEEWFYPVIAKQIAGMFSRPEEVVGIYNKLTHDQGWNLDYEGNILFFSSSRYGGVGNQDIWMSKKSGNKWSAPVNLAKPINSGGNETDPFISPNGKKLFFVRLTGTQGPDGQKCGKIMMTEKSGGIWKDPVELPSPVNKGCECAPSLLADNRTLLFASVRPEGKGGFDIYETRIQDDGTFSKPVSLSFINTNRDEIHVSVPADGKYLYFTAPKNEKADLFKIKVPDEFKPLPFIRLESSATDSVTGKPVTSKIRVIKNKDGKIIEEFYNTPDGKFLTILSGKNDLVLTAFPPRNYFFDSFTLNPETPPTSTPAFSLLALTTGNELEMQTITFSEKSIILTGQPELQNLVKTLKDNPNVKVEITADIQELIEDTIVQPGLTETKDSTITLVEKIINSIDSLSGDTLFTDTLITFTRKYYHNNRTQKQAEEVRAYLVSAGIPAQRVLAKGYGDRRKKFTEISGSPSTRIGVKVL